MANPNPSPLPNGRQQITQALDARLAQGLGTVYPAWGRAQPPPAATVSGSPRLVLGLSGRNTMAIPQGDTITEITLGAGDLVCIDRRAWNHPLHLHAKTFLTIDSKDDRIRFYIRRADGPGSTPGAAALTWVLRPPEPCTRHLIAACESLLGPRHDHELLRQTAGCLLTQYAREYARPQAIDPEHTTWTVLRDWIDDHLHEDIDRTACARAAGIHPNHVSRLFRRHAGCRFIDHLRRLRLDRARHLLEHSALPIADIAQRCGFTSGGYFATIFKRRFGCTPGSLR